MTIKFKLLFIVMTVGLLIIIGTDFFSPQKWAWVDYLMNRRIPDEEPTIKSFDKIQYMPGLDLSLFKTVLDGGGWMKGDYDAWKNVVDLLDSHNEREIEKYSFGHTTYVQLRAQPKVFRGVIVTLRGNAMQCLEIPTPDLPGNRKSVYRIALSPDSSPNEPVVLNVLDLPKDFPLGEEIKPQRIEFSGFFFKRWAYPSQTDVRSAPLLIGKTIRWAPPVETPQKDDLPIWTVLLIGLFVAIVLFIGMNWYAKLVAPKYEKPNVKPEFHFDDSKDD